MLLLLILISPLFLWLLVPLFRSMGMGWLFLGAFVAASMVVAAKTRMQAAELASLDCGFIWKLDGFIPGAFVLQVGTPSLISGWFCPRRDAVILVRQIVRWSFDAILLVTTVAAALRHYYEPRWTRAAGCTNSLPPASRCSPPEHPQKTPARAELPKQSPTPPNRVWRLRTVQERQS